jgi:hypothetical protein
MVWVIEIDIKWVTENSGSLCKRNPVLLKIGRSFGFIPLMIHERSITPVLSL